MNKPISESDRNAKSWNFGENEVQSKDYVLPVSWRGDVLVCGGGPAGIGAAMAAARSGKRTLLIERYGFLGGMCSYGSGMPMGGAYPGYKSIGGIAEEILTRVREAGREAADVRDVHLFGYWYFHDSDFFRKLAFDVTEEAGVELLLHTFAAGVLMDGKKLRGVHVCSKGGPAALLADTVIDCTGDADIAAWAGVPFQRGRDTDGAYMAVTIPYIMFDIDTDAFMAHAEQDPGFEKTLAEARASGVPVSQDDKYTSWHKGIRPGTIFSNLVRVRNVDATDPVAVTAAEKEARRRMYCHLDFFRRFVPGCEKAYIGKTGEQIGIRDTRRIVGEKTLTADDCSSYRKQEDTILRCAGPFDNTTRGKEHIALNEIDMNNYYDIPYGCIVPQGIDNLLVAGRCFSADYLAQSGSRGMGLLMGMGQAAGTAAALITGSSTAARDLDTKTLQSRLTKDGAVLWPS